MWVAISKTCQDCGAKLAVQVLDTQPSDEDCRANEDELGGMFCIKTVVIEAEIGSIVKSEFD